MGARVIDTRDQAIAMHRTFNDREHRRIRELPFTWPKEIVELGAGQSVMYRSNKWKFDRSEYEDYKHVAESPNIVYSIPGFLHVYDDDERRLIEHRMDGERYALKTPLPKHVAVLAPFLGLQVDFSDGSGKHEIRVPRATLAGARHPVTDECFLVVYDATGVKFLIMGEKLDVEQDGITG